MVWSSLVCIRTKVRNRTTAALAEVVTPDVRRSEVPNSGGASIPTLAFYAIDTSGTVINALNFNDQRVFHDGYGVEILQSINFLDRAVNARFDCGDRVACTEGTRVSVIQEISTWTVKGADPSVFWLNGSAGTGKSTIAFTVAEALKKRGSLGASFFCSRDDATCSNHKNIFPSIAYQLALLHPSFAQHLAAVVKKRPEIIIAHVACQLQELIVDPLAAASGCISRCVIVIDALDECKDDSAISVILAALSRYVQKLPGIKILITSRPELNINHGFREHVLQSATRSFVLHEIELSAVEADITTYLKPQLEITRDLNGIRKGWPSFEEVNFLSKLSFGLFIYAATSIKFIQDPNYADPQGQLTRILSNTSLPSGEHAHHLDLLYLQVLTSAHPNISEPLADRLRIIIGTIVFLQDPLSLHSIEQLLSMENPKRFHDISVRQTLMRLHSIILVPSDDKRVVRALHPSLFDFITNPDRCMSPQFLVDPAKQHTVLLIACLRKMKSLGRNICEISDGSALNSEVVDLLPRIAKFIPPELQYACRHWVAHCIHAIHSDEVSKLLDEFCKEHLLFWIEACSLLGDLRNQLVLLDAVQRTWMSPEEEVSTTAICLNDCERFIREFFPAISVAWAHVYESALGFAPYESTLRKFYPSQLSKLKVINGPQIWDQCSRFLEGHFGEVNSAKFSPDGRRILSSSQDGSIRLWDAVSGAHLTTLQGHADGVNEATFSPDGNLIASVSHDQTVRLWDAVSGAHLKTLQRSPNNYSPPWSVAFSPDGQRILYGPEDNVFKLWDPSSGKVLNLFRPAKGESSDMTCAAFSPDGIHIISGSNHGASQLWDALSGARLMKFPLTASYCVNCVEFSPDGTSFATGDTHGNIKLQSSIDGARLMLFKENSTLTSVAFSPDGATIASCSNTVRLWDVVSGAMLRTLTGHSGHLNEVSFSPNGHSIVFACDDNTVRIWNIGHNIRPTQYTRGIGEAGAIVEEEHNIGQGDSEVAQGATCPNCGQNEIARSRCITCQEIPPVQQLHAIPIQARPGQNY
ncbi:hypothetical protein FIBSPDRAFT_928039 [Athelia psychrophila]|uniref:NACHT domain-containing protein n=1 Tax=Athelia psychrophila TaxID=1759441 RepID=A0A166QT32_9AGAM|nr:hypothetical protein FIBSPDRAFT_928039 [Fibularhizoctonia sp. CBS 109695]